MKKIALVLILCLTLSSCNKNDDNIIQNNQYIPDIAFDTGELINLSLPQYSDLRFAGNHYITPSNYGVNGVVVYNAGNNNFSAFELTDPNHALRNCSTLTVEGVLATCDCDDSKTYDILTGQPQEGTTGIYGLKRYFVEKTGDIIRVWNN
ncbi:hypothetical protein C1T31_02645 [Hanstruepera neustonica]|uniref:Rieske domain-containing protein n=1 Tax=Hanstruepera neustonica TaxID=1445657 RepID=A0A2K1E442_9FLAO|nr:hypothetical protein [Hanstruepera neustonica]PNQ75052.1 hypothetical protein C1T31_02645 [Hanstruepera neustonica]